MTQKNQHIQFDPIHLLITNEKGSVICTHKEYQLFFYIHSGIEKRPELMSKIWPGFRVEHKCFHVHLCSLRKKIRVIGLEIRTRDRRLYQYIEKTA